MGIIYSSKPLAKRRQYEHYPTASGLVEAMLQIPIISQNEFQRVCDPSAGTGVFGAKYRTLFPRRNILHGVELQPCLPNRHYDEWYMMDFFRFASIQRRSYDLIMGNPPYGGTHRDLAEMFVRTSIAMLEDDGVLIFLLRSAFLEGQNRGKNLFSQCKYRPSDIYQLSRRPSFTGNGKTDSTAYSAFVWNKGYECEYSRMWLLDWGYGEPIEEDNPFRPFPLLTDSQYIPPIQVYLQEQKPIFYDQYGQVRLF